MPISTNQILKQSQFNLLYNKPYLITDFEDQISENLKEEIIDNNPKLIRFMTHPSEKLQFRALRSQNKADFTSKYIFSPSENVIKSCIEYDPYKSLLSIRNISERLQIYALNISPTSLEVIRHPSDNLQLISLKNCWTRGWYDQIINFYSRDNEKEFQRRVNKLKLIKGPLE